MAQLSDADRQAILGPNYKAPIETQATLDDRKSAKWTTYRNTAIGIAVLAVFILVVGFFRT